LAELRSLPKESLGNFYLRQSIVNVYLRTVTLYCKPLYCTAQTRARVLRWAELSSLPLYNAMRTTMATATTAMAVRANERERVRYIKVAIVAGWNPELKPLSFLLSTLIGIGCGWNGLVIKSLDPHFWTHICFAARHRSGHRPVHAKRGEYVPGLAFRRACPTRQTQRKLREMSPNSLGPP